jgi:acetyl-CoA carboxylase biotin carboxyl carrier protein
VLAEGSGTLARLAVGEGDVVQEGDLIAVIE